MPSVKPNLTWPPAAFEVWAADAVPVNSTRLVMFTRVAAYRAVPLPDAFVAPYDTDAPKATHSPTRHPQGLSK